MCMLNTCYDKKLRLWEQRLLFWRDLFEYEMVVEHAREFRVPTEVR